LPVALVYYVDNAWSCRVFVPLQVLV